jgi:4-hydroxy-tetrahydrodipicolinate synthase
LPLYALGGKGLISVLANAYPTIFKKMKEYFLAGNHTKAAQELYKLSDLNGPMYEEGNPIGVKYVLSKLGICGESVRLPHAPASAGLRKRIDALLADFRK